jgi:hypothetical protein
MWRGCVHTSAASPPPPRLRPCMPAARQPPPPPPPPHKPTPNTTGPAAPRCSTTPLPPRMAPCTTRRPAGPSTSAASSSSTCWRRAGSAVSVLFGVCACARARDGGLHRTSGTQHACLARCPSRHPLMALGHHTRVPLKHPGHPLKHPRHPATHTHTRTRTHTHTHTTHAQQPLRSATRPRRARCTTPSRRRTAFTSAPWSPRCAPA